MIISFKADLRRLLYNVPWLALGRIVCNGFCEQLKRTCKAWLLAYHSKRPEVCVRYDSVAQLASNTKFLQRLHLAWPKNGVTSRAPEVLENGRREASPERTCRI